jgi:hypothetical protein
LAWTWVLITWTGLAYGFILLQGHLARVGGRDCSWLGLWFWLPGLGLANCFFLLQGHLARVGGGDLKYQDDGSQAPGQPGPHAWSFYSNITLFQHY